MNDFYLPYSFLIQNEQKVVKMFCDPPQIMTASELYQWMKEVRDSYPPLYEILVKIYFQLRKPDDNK